MTKPGLDRNTRLLLVIAISGACVMLTVLVALFGPHGASVNRLPRGLDRAVEQALIDHGYFRLDVRMSGQRAILTGEVDAPEAIRDAQHVALKAAGAGGLWAGGVTRVDMRWVRVRTPEPDDDPDAAEAAP